MNVSGGDHAESDRKAVRSGTSCLRGSDPVAQDLQARTYGKTQMTSGQKVTVGWRCLGCSKRLAEHEDEGR